MTDPRESRFCPGWDAGWHLSRHTSQRDVRLANALPHHHRPHLAWVAFLQRSALPGRGWTAILYNTLRGRGLPTQLGRWPSSLRPRDCAWADPPSGQPDTPPHTLLCSPTLMLLPGPASFWTIPTLPPDPGGARTPPGIDLGVWVPTGHPGMPVPHKAQPGAVQNE